MEKARDIPWNNPRSEDEEMETGGEKDGASASAAPSGNSGAAAPVNPASTFPPAIPSPAPAAPANPCAGNPSPFGHPLGGAGGGGGGGNANPPVKPPANPFAGIGGIAPACSQPPVGNPYHGKGDSNN